MLKLTEKENKSVDEINGRRCPHRLIVFIAYIVGNMCWVRVRFFSILTKYENIFYLLFKKYKISEKLKNK